MSALFGLFKSLRPAMPVRVAFHAPVPAARRPLWKLTLEPNRRFELTVVICAKQLAHVHAWCDALLDHVRAGMGGVQIDTPIPPPRACHGPDFDGATHDEGAELALEFLSPLPFTREAGGERTHIAPGTLAALFNRRITAWFGVHEALCPAPSLQCNAAFWRYNEFRRFSKSAQKRRPVAPAGEPGVPIEPTHFVNGCRGLLLLRGVPPGWLPWLRVLERIHAAGGTDLSPLGHFRILGPAPSLIDAALLDAAAMAEVIEEITHNHDVEPDIDTATGRLRSADELAQALCAALAEGRYRPGATQRFTIARAGPDGGQRHVERLTLADHAVQRRLLTLVDPVVDATLSPSAFAYRRQRSREQALAALRAALAGGYRYAVRADIADFFPSVQHEPLILLLDQRLPRADRLTRDALLAAVRAPWQEGDGAEECPREQGLAQGAPLSPMLANLYLDDFDRAIRSQGLELCRYGDDFVILARTAEQARAALAEVQRLLAPRGLALSATKTAIVRVDDGFDFLGERIDGREPTDPVVALAAQHKPVLVTEPYVSLGANGDALEIRRSGKPVGVVPLRRVSEIIALAPISISTALIQRCAQQRIPLAVALPRGYQIACFLPDSREFMRVAHMQAQRHEQMGAAQRAGVASAFVAAKLDNYAAWIKANFRAGDATLLAYLGRARDTATACATVAAMRGHEGTAARACFAWLRARIRDDQQQAFRSDRRARGAPDRLNSMLNFGYYLQFNRLNGLLRTHGLNPYLGYLHDGQDDYETLVADLQDVFRVHVDRTVLRLINRREITSAHFGDEMGRYRLTRDGAHRVAAALEATLNQRLDGTTLSDLMLAQVRSLRGFAVQGEQLWLHRWRPVQPPASAADAQLAPLETAADEETEEDGV